MLRKTYADSDNETEAPSRSELKRQSTALQKLGEELAALSPAIWKTFSISPDLYTALDEYRKIRTHEGKRRQLQFIGRLMREENNEQIAAELERLKAGQNLHTTAFHQLERMRDLILQNDRDVWNELEKRLTTPDSALTEADKQAVLSELHKLAQQAIQKQDKGSSRVLFRALRNCLEL